MHCPASSPQTSLTTSRSQSCRHPAFGEESVRGPSLRSRSWRSSTQHPVCPDLCLLQGPPVGTRIPAGVPPMPSWWPSITHDARELSAVCTSCSRGKYSHQPPAGLLNPLPVPWRPWSHIMVDLGNLLVQHVFWLHGPLTDMVSDHSQFTIRVSGAFCAAFSTMVSLTSGYHPQPNSQVEHANQSLESTLRCVTACHPMVWSSWLPWVEYAHNSKVSAALGMRLHCGTSRPCSSTRRRRLPSRPSGPTSTVAIESGDRCVRLFCVLLPRSTGQQTARRRSLTGRYC